MADEQSQPHHHHRGAAGEVKDADPEIQAHVDAVNDLNSNFIN